MSLTFLYFRLKLCYLLFLHSYYLHLSQLFIRLQGLSFFVFGFKYISSIYQLSMKCHLRNLIAKVSYALISKLNTSFTIVVIVAVVFSEHFLMKTYYLPHLLEISICGFSYLIEIFNYL